MYCRSMIIAPLRRSFRNRLLRTLITIFLFWNCLDVLRVRWDLQSAQAAAAATPAVTHEKIYIASTHWNNEKILRSHWNAALVALCRAVGPENVYVSIYESGSYDNTKGALAVLDEVLGRIGVRRTIVMDETTHVDEIGRSPAATGWIKTPRGRSELRRIPYLARLRNLSLKPLEDMAVAGERFDKVLFLNDVVFTVCHLLHGSVSFAGRYRELTPATGARYHGLVWDKWWPICLRVLIGFLETAQLLRHFRTP